MSGAAPMQVIAGLEPAELCWRVDVDVLVVEFRGRRHSPTHMASCWRAVQELAADRSLGKVLAIDLMDDEPLTGEQRSAFIGSLGLDVFAGRRWAYVARSVDRVSAYEATQLDAQEQGLDVRVFSSLAEAELWVRFPG
ncbi:MAG: hypothetical protein ACRC2H_08470 [Silanimonas sp.]